jgi:hypothetical protein
VVGTWAEPKTVSGGDDSPVAEAGHPAEVRKKTATGGEEDEGRSRATKPPTPRLAAVEAAEQAQNLRVVGGGSSPAPEKEAAGEGENRGIA